MLSSCLESDEYSKVCKHREVLKPAAYGSHSWLPAKGTAHRCGYTDVHSPMPAGLSCKPFTFPLICTAQPFLTRFLKMSRDAYGSVKCYTRVNIIRILPEIIWKVVKFELKYYQIALNIAFQHFYPLWVVVKQAWVVVKIAKWWLEPTTPDQCGENPDNYTRCHSHASWYQTLPISLTISIEILFYPQVA